MPLGRRRIKMHGKAIEILIMMLVKMFDADLMKEFAEHLVTWVETRVLGSASKLDDAIVLPLCTAVRAAFNLEKVGMK